MVSAQPPSSKWWWKGAMRNTRRPVVRKNAIWMTTDMISATNSAPMTTASSSVRVVIDSPASRPPRANEPVSPMKILAGAAFHQRNPRHAPPPATAISARSKGSRTW
ncbi:Uncharacterised protein [Mycobacteroides abscessus subsp. abscessus]|nr:Uncharacterised protein [Mycobacteroides abscessus subsp. abscessus]